MHLCVRSFFYTYLLALNSKNNKNTKNTLTQRSMLIIHIIIKTKVKMNKLEKV